MWYKRDRKEKNVRKMGVVDGKKENKLNFSLMLLED